VEAYSAPIRIELWHADSGEMGDERVRRACTHRYVDEDARRRRTAPEPA
jgi:hypothetical protein